MSVKLQNSSVPKMNFFEFKTSEIGSYITLNPEPKALIVLIGSNSRLPNNHEWPDMTPYYSVWSVTLNHRLSWYSVYIESVNGNVVYAPSNTQGVYRGLYWI